MQAIGEIWYDNADMEWTVIGLGNPGNMYEGTRHNVGRDVLIVLARKEGIREWKEEKRPRMQIATGMLYGHKTRFILPNTYMNDSGLAVKGFIKTKKDLEKLVVLQDDLDLPLGKVKISYGNTSGGHKGIESIQRNLKTKDFVRIRIGISGTTPSGKTKKPAGEKVVDFVLGTFKESEQEKLKKVRKTVQIALTFLLEEGRGHAMTHINAL